MIELYKASAGSGKTYTLAKRYIYYLITIRDDASGKRRLRFPDEIKDSASHILAVTFTNKATGEMKERIVERLSDLSGRRRDADYLKDFMAELGESEERIREACRYALSDILVNFNNFHVSTIDSFFQSVLRTFAYEADLPDSYQVEIDSDLSARVGVDGTLSSVNGPNPDTDVRYWLEFIMKSQLGKGKKWNLFHKGIHRNSLYGVLLGNAKRMESESFKKIRGELDVYYGDGTPLRESYEAYEDVMTRGLRDAEQLLKTKAEEVLSRISCDEAIAREYSNFSKFTGRLRKAVAGDFSFKFAGDRDKADYFKKSKTGGEVSAPLREEINRLSREFYDACTHREAEQERESYKLWQIYREQIPYLGLLSAVRRNISDFYGMNNVVQLAETNTLLRRVIGDDEAPFIYERMGSYLNHYLIDEFQDTSEMQWDNLVPLLDESESRGEEKLIIGDAKQSIYRFRNAAPWLIQSGVRREFPGVMERGDDPRENTNYRSRRRIVEFNNTLFTLISSRIDSDKDDAGWRDERRLESLYSNVKQRVSKDEFEPEGYVRVEFTDKDGDKVKEEQGREDDGNDGRYPSNYSKIIDTILDIRGRYGSVGEIGILVNRNKEGRWVVNSLMAYNQSREREEDKIRFVSDESLLISSAESVRIIIGVLKILESQGTDQSDVVSVDGETDAIAGRDEPSAGTSFNFFRLRHRDMDGGRLVDAYFSCNDNSGVIGRFMDSVHSASLPALVDAVIENFVSEELRRQDAAFLAAFQDLVSEQCDVYPTDIASFLKWWGQRGVSKSITTPEGQDAVNIMTIHKAKGLAFDFVIVPSLDVKMSLSASQGDNSDPGAREWRWIRPSLEPIVIGDKEINLPPYIPVPMSRKTGEIDVFSGIYRDFVNAYEMDEINKVYVAFTRPVKELYVFASLPSKPGKQGGGNSGVILRDALERWPDNDGGGLEKSALKKTALNHVDSYGNEMETVFFEVGEKSSAERDNEAEEVRRKSAGTESTDAGNVFVRQCMVESYDVYRRAEGPRYREETMPLAEDDSDPRSEGNLLHRLMQWTEHSRDLERALRRMRVSGGTTPEKLEEYGNLLRDALASEKGREWFSDDVRVLNERPIVKRGDFTRRPDRIIETRDGRAIVIDFKFGQVKEDRYRKQVSGYCKALQAACPRYRSIEGWLWYVRLGETERVIP